MTQQERFEAWATSQGINITDNGFGGYDSQWTEGALAGWEAAQAQEAVEPVNDHEFWIGVCESHQTCQACTHFKPGKNPLVGVYESTCFECKHYYASRYEAKI